MKILFWKSDGLKTLKTLTHKLTYQLKRILSIIIRMISSKFLNFKIFNLILKINLKF